VGFCALSAKFFIYADHCNSVYLIVEQCSVQIRSRTLFGV